MYTQRYNRRHKCDGQLFRGRYKSILIDTDSYLLQAVRYIHRNALQSGLAKKIDAYILKMRRGKMNEGRNVAIYLTRRLRRDTLKEIGAQFGIENDSTVSSIMERMKKKLSEDRKFALRLDEIAESITKS